MNRQWRKLPGDLASAVRPALVAQFTDQDEVQAQQAADLGLRGCPHCGTTWRDVSEGEPCGRCGTRLHQRKPDSLRRTWALLIAACIMYVPANLLPIMITRSLFGVQQDTILSGVIYFWVSGAYGLAAIIFVASFLVPLFKLTALFLMVVLAQRGSDWRRPERAKLYHAVEIIGRWSMLDVFVVSLLVGLVRIKGFAEITAGVGIAAFGAVVVLTMLASLSFDPRLTWGPRLAREPRQPRRRRLATPQPIPQPPTSPHDGQTA